MLASMFSTFGVNLRLDEQVEQLALARAGRNGPSRASRLSELAHALVASVSEGCMRLTTQQRAPAIFRSPTLFLGAHHRIDGVRLRVNSNVRLQSEMPLVAPSWSDAGTWRPTQGASPPTGLFATA